MGGVDEARIHELAVRTRLSPSELMASFETIRPQLELGYFADRYDLAGAR
jgi:hypothetical protein